MRKKYQKSFKKSSGMNVFESNNSGKDKIAEFGNAKLFEQIGRYLNDYQTVSELERGIKDYIEFYNYRRWQMIFYNNIGAAVSLKIN